MNNKPILYDFHTHIESESELKVYLEDNITPVINIRSNEEYIQILKHYNNINKNNTYNKVLFFSIGIHPFDAEKWDNRSVEFYNEGLKYSKFIGEIGMDGLWSDVNLSIQEEAFTKSLEIAEKNNLPVILHTKGMEGKILEIIKNYNLKYIIHWYSCENYIDEFIDLGCFFTFGSAVKIDKNVLNLAKKVPYDKILVETDGNGALNWLFNTDINNDIRFQLESTIEELAIIKNVSKEFIYDKIKNNSELLLERE